MSTIERRSQTPGAGCPHLDEFDPVRADQNENPFPWFARARKEAPVFYLPDHEMYVVTRHEDALAIYRDPVTFSNVGSHDLRVAPPDALRAEVPTDYVFPLALGQLNVSDPPEHTRRRKLMQGSFTPKFINVREPQIRKQADELIERFVDDGRVELMEEFAFPLPINVVGSILGVPDDVLPNFRRWAEDFFRLTGAADIPEDESIERWRSVLELDRWVRDFVAERRRHPQDDMTSQLILSRADDGSPSLSDDEVLANIVGIVLAGSDTTSILIGHTVYFLLQHGLWDGVKEDRSRLNRAIEESLRFLGPVRGLRRTTTKEVELGGVTIPKGATIWLVIQSANRDEAVFESPDNYNIERKNVGEHLAFGIGAHFCIGAPLARLEARVAIERLMDQLPDLRIAREQGELEYMISMVLPSLLRLELEWDRA